MLLDRKRVKFWQKWVFLLMAVVMVAFLVMIPISGRGCAGSTSSVTKQLDTAVTQANAKAQADPQNADAWIALAEAHQSRANVQTANSTAQANDYRAATAAYTKATALLDKQKKVATVKQKLLDTYQKMVTVDLFLKDYQAATSLYGEITALTPKDSQAFFEWASVAINAGDTNAALLAFTRFLQLDPNSSYAPEVRAWIKKNAPSPTPKPSSTKGSKQ